MHESAPIILNRADTIESELLLLCCQVTSTSERSERIKELVNNRTDWKCLLNIAARHHLRPLLYWNLIRVCPNQIPREVFAYLFAHVQSITRSNKILTAELVRLVTLFESKNIFIIAYKGPIADALFFGNLFLREYRDLDFLVRREDLSKACEILEADGYHLKQEMSPFDRSHHELVAKEYLYYKFTMLDKTIPICVEPHWSITMPRFPFEINYPELWLRAKRIEFHGAHILSFAPEDAILVLCAVGSKSQWKRLLMVCDFAEAIRTYANIDWIHCLQRARTLGCERMLLVAVLLAGELMESVPSPDPLQQARSDRKVISIAQEVYSRFFHEYRSPVLDPSTFSSLLWRIRERPRDKWQYLIRTLTTPNLIHIRRIPLHKHLFPLYRVIVPIYDYILRPCWKVGPQVWHQQLRHTFRAIRRRFSARTP